MKDEAGNVHEATFVPDRADPRYGKKDLIIDRKVVNHFDVAGLGLVEASDEERADLARAGYGFKE